jgi:hypothetical protein
LTDVFAEGSTVTRTAQAIEQFIEVLGADAVLTTEADLREFRDPYSHASWDQHNAAAVVLPTTVEQVQQIVRIAFHCGRFPRAATMATAVPRRAYQVRCWSTSVE